jgi:metallophosphoesterase (TIGR03767 family)
MTDRTTPVPGPIGPGGWRDLVPVPVEPPTVRADLITTSSEEGERPGRHLLSFLHLSDLHVMDAQSPARSEYLDRIADPDSPLRERFPAVGCCRPQDMLTSHLVEAMVRALNDLVASRPLPVRFAVATGDMTDNTQANELSTYLTLLDGGKVEPDSGDPGRYEGVAASDPATWDERYWHPEGPPPGCEPDLPTRRFGYPTVPGLLDAARRPFAAAGLDVGWYAVHGNHDALLQGTVAPDDALRDQAVGGRRFTGLAPAADPAATLDAAGEVGPARYPDPVGAPAVTTTPDPRRALVDRREFVAAHLAGGRPAGHGFTATNLRDGTTYWSCDVDPGAGPAVRLIALDTVNPHGGWQGSLDRDQVTWLEAELRAASGRWIDTAGQVRTQDVTDRLVIVASHHPSSCLTNPYSPDGTERAGGDEVAALLLRYPNVVLWVDGHTHAHRVTPHARPPGSPVGGGFWEITTASVIDWPQQARSVDLSVTDSGLLAIDVSVIDHAGPARPGGSDPAGPREPSDSSGPGPGWSLDDPAQLAGLARTLSVNFWQWRDLGAADLPRGRPTDREATLLLPTPFAL